MEDILKKWKGTIVKLVAVSNLSEFYGYLHDENDFYYAINKPIGNINRLTLDPADVINSIIKYEYKKELGSATTLSIATTYRNVDNLNLAYFPKQQFMFIPLYDYDITDTNGSKADMEHIKKVYEEYIDHFYNTMFEIKEELQKAVDEETKGEDDAK